MNITNIQIHPSTGDTPRLATVTIVIDNAISMHGLGIVKRKNDEGLFVSMPSHKNKNGEYRDIYFHPVSSEARQDLTDKVLDAWAKYQENPDVTSFDMGDPNAEIKVDSIRFFDRKVEDRVYVSASAVLDDAMVLSLIGMGHRNDDEQTPYIRMPGRRMADGESKDVYHPISAEARQALCEAIFKAYDERDTSAEA